MAGQNSFGGIDRESLRRAGRMVVSIEGMWCGSCALAVERTIARVPGVTWASTSFAGGSALVRWDPSRFDLDQLFARVEQLGYRIVPLVETGEMEQRIDAQARAVLLRLAVAAFFGMWSMLGSLGLYLDSQLAASTQGWWVALASGCAALPVVSFSAWAFLRAGWRTLRAGVPGMDALVSLGVLTAIILSVWRLAQGSSEVYFDTATMLVGFMLCGRLIELHARRRNADAVNALRQAVPETARRLGADGSVTEVPVAQVLPGDRVRVHAGERIAVDGVVLDGESEVDRAVINGESAPAAVRRGDQVEAGSINLSCALIVQVERAYGQRFLDRIGVRMFELFGAKSAVALQAERFARWLLPVAVGLAALSFVIVWLEGGSGVAASLRALSVLVAACPCAVGLALPLAYTAAVTSAAPHGILFRDPASLEALARAQEILFDKTGTLTHGRLEVAEVHFSEGTLSADLLSWAALAETGMAHPIARAIRAAAPQSVPSDRAEAGISQRHAQGSAWHSTDQRQSILVGNAEWMQRLGVAVPEGAARPGTRIEVARNGQWRGSLFLQDRVRDDAAETVQVFSDAGIAVQMVTGDSEKAAMPVSLAAGLAPAQLQAGCTPEQKAEIVSKARRPVVFVGDGVNDALALAGADCGIAMQGASTAAVATAGVVIASGGLAGVVAAWRHARRTVGIVRQNLVFSMLYNAAVLGLAAFGTIPPVAAAGAMLASSISVVANAARLTRFRGWS
jgi:heavy metal translocating P-type ATPase